MHAFTSTGIDLMLPNTFYISSLVVLFFCFFFLLQLMKWRSMDQTSSSFIDSFISYSVEGVGFFTHNHHHRYMIWSIEMDKWENEVISWIKWDQSILDQFNSSPISNLLINQRCDTGKVGAEISTIDVRLYLCICIPAFIYKVNSIMHIFIQIYVFRK